MPVATAQPAAIPHPPNPFRIEAPRDYAADEWLGYTSLVSQDGLSNPLESREASRSTLSGEALSRASDTFLSPLEIMLFASYASVRILQMNFV